MNKETRCTLALAAIALRGFTLPSKARWIAQDEDGEWFAYENKPTLDGHEWVNNDGTGGSLFVLRLGFGDSPKDFTKEIYEL